MIYLFDDYYIKAGVSFMNTTFDLYSLYKKVGSEYKILGSEKTFEGALKMACETAFLYEINNNDYELDDARQLLERIRTKLGLNKSDF